MLLGNAVDASKASGPDGVSSGMHKATAHSIAPSLTKLVNISIRTGKIPGKWKLSAVVPIPKTPAGSSDPREYRPISLLSVVSKKHIRSLVFEHLMENGLLSYVQWSFRQIHNDCSTVCLS